MAGGPNKNSGRKLAVDRAEFQDMASAAMKAIWNTKTPKESKIMLLQKILASDAGRKWVAEHIWGKPIEQVVVDQTTEITVKWTTIPKTQIG